MDPWYDIVELTPNLTKLKIMWVHLLMKLGHRIQSLSSSWFNKRRCLVCSRWAHPPLLLPSKLPTVLHLERHSEIGMPSVHKCGCSAWPKSSHPIGMGGLNPQCWVYLKTNTFQDTRDDEGEKNATFSIRRIVKRSHRIQNHLTNIELFSREYNINKSSKRSTNLSTMVGMVETNR